LDRGSGQRHMVLRYDRAPSGLKTTNPSVLSASDKDTPGRTVRKLYGDIGTR
jgi:hypothetical protein